MVVLVFSYRLRYGEIRPHHDIRYTELLLSSGVRMGYDTFMRCRIYDTTPYQWINDWCLVA